MAVTSLLAVTGCSATAVDNDDGSQKRRGGIVNGTETSDYPATGMLMTQGQAICTGTVVGLRSVLTAAHCVDGSDPSQLQFGFGPTQDQVEASVGIVAAAQHPEWDSQQLLNDVAVLTLSDDAPVAPIALNQLMDDTWVGRPVTLVGYGVSDGPSQSGGGIKRMVEVTIDQVDAQTLHYTTQAGKTACNGDSGGPAFADENGQLVVAGVTSYGDQNCQEYGVYTRVDTYLDFINEQVTNGGGPGDPANPGDPGCDPADPNCNPGNPADPGCDPADPNCNPGNPGDPGCDPADPNCDPGYPGDPGGDPGGGSCGGETYEGRCEGNTVVWCEEGEVMWIDCDTGCGLNPEAGYYDCM